jgi:erythromycin esterase-like protein
MSARWRAGRARWSCGATTPIPGDARATFAADRGELNLGQLMRQRMATRLSGRLLHLCRHRHGRAEWDAPGRVYQLRPALSESYSGLFHTSGPELLAILRGNPRPPSSAGSGWSAPWA